MLFPVGDGVGVTSLVLYCASIRDHRISCSALASGEPTGP